MIKGKNVIQFAAQIDGARVKKDRTMVVDFNTQEMTPDDAAHIFEMFEKHVWVAVSETEVSPDDLNIPESIAEKGDKSPSQRLRSVLFVYWKQNEKKINKTFNVFYDGQMEKIIDYMKDKLKDRDTKGRGNDDKEKEFKEW